MGEDYLQWLYGGQLIVMSKPQGVSPKFRTPVTQNVAPNLNNGPQTYKGVTDYNPGSGENAVGEKAGTPWGMIASIAASNLRGFFDGLNPGIYASDLLLQAGTSNSSVGGVGYQIQNNVDAGRIKSEYDRNNVSKIFSGNIGGFIGGLFGRRKLKRQIAEAQVQANRTTNFNRDVATTTGMLLDFNLKHGNTEDQVLYAKHGKDMNKKGKTIGFGAVETAEGLKNGPLNAWVSAGEGIYNPSTGYARLITHGQNDTAKANLKAEDVVFGDLKNPETGRTFKKDAAQYILAKENLNKKRPKTNDETTLKVFEATSKPLADALDAKLQDLALIQERTRAINDYTGMLKAKHGKNGFPRFELGGGLDNALAAILGTGVSIGQYFDAKNQDIYRPHTYVGNKYERRALADMYGLRISPYNIIKQVRDAASRAYYATDMSGGLSAGQKMLLKAAITANTQKNIADTNQQIAEKNIALRSSADSAALQAGAQDASNMMNALRWDSNIYAKAHAARLSGMQTAQQNFLAQIQQYLANEYKRRMGNATIDLYSSDLRNKSKK